MVLGRREYPIGKALGSFPVGSELPIGKGASFWQGSFLVAVELPCGSGAS